MFENFESMSLLCIQLRHNQLHVSHATRYYLHMMVAKNIFY
jgi:hypothetical protein